MEGTLRLILGVELGLFMALRIWAEPKSRRAISEKESRPYVRLMSAVGLVQMGSLVLSVVAPRFIAFADLPLPVAARLVGTVLGVFTLAGLVWCHLSLGHNYHSVLHLREGHEMITRGPYRRVRHPMYTALFLKMIAFSIASSNLLVTLSCLGGLTVVVVRRVPREEALLVARFGSIYRDYMERTNRFLP